MARAEMYDYLSVVTPDYNQTLDVSSGVLRIYRRGKEAGSFNQVIHLGDDGSEQRISLDSSPIFYVTFGWQGLEPEDAGTIFDWYFDTAKAYGKGRSFKWSHPEDGHDYVVRFDMDLDRTVDPIRDVHALPDIRLKVLGRVS